MDGLSMASKSETAMELAAAQDRLEDLEAELARTKGAFEGCKLHSATLETALNGWQSLALDVATTLEEIATQRLSMTMTEHRAAEIFRDNNAALARLAARLREQLR